MITIKIKLKDISNMLETSYTLNLGQLFKIASKFKTYIWPKLKAKKT